MSLSRPASSSVRILRATRSISSSATRREEVVGLVGNVPPPRTGGFRGGLLGFLFGFAVASSGALYFLQRDTAATSAQLLDSVERFERGTQKMTSHLSRLETVEKGLAELKASMAGSEDVGKVRGEMRKLYDGIHMEVLDLRAHVWGVEQDLSKVVSNDSVTI